MRDLPDLGILFSSSMVLALLAGRKTQTRRLVNPQPMPECPFTSFDGRTAIWRRVYSTSPEVSMTSTVRCRFAPVGRRLWVRETWAPYPEDRQDPATDVCYRADRTTWGSTETDPPNVNRPKPWLDLERNPTLAAPKWRPSLLMPRWASRITLEVTEIRVQRIQDISEEDAAAEGCDVSKEDHVPLYSHRATFERLWDTINPAAPWTSNPWVFAVGFRRIDV